MIGLPFFVWLAFTLVDFGNIDQLFAFLAVFGLILIVITRNKQRTLSALVLDIFCFILIASPLVARMKEVPIELFNYNAFIIPTGLFVLFYFVSLYFTLKVYVLKRKSRLVAK